MGMFSFVPTSETSTGVYTPRTPTDPLPPSPPLPTPPFPAKSPSSIPPAHPHFHTPHPTPHTPHPTPHTPHPTPHTPLHYQHAHFTTHSTPHTLHPLHHTLYTPHFTTHTHHRMFGGPGVTASGSAGGGAPRHGDPGTLAPGGGAGGGGTPALSSHAPYSASSGASAPTPRVLAAGMREPTPPRPPFTVPTHHDACRECRPLMGSLLGHSICFPPPPPPRPAPSSSDPLTSSLR
jgi:hypothetical protein